jgi:hypothetical protein
LTAEKSLCYCSKGASLQTLFKGRRTTGGERRKRTVVITGFNTDIEHEGVTYHVQTEDKGLDTPLILSLVYSGGAILASKRSPYDDLIASGFDEKLLADRLQRQHKLICAAIHAGRIGELKLMSQREAGARTAQKAERKEEEQRAAKEAQRVAAEEQRDAHGEPPASAQSEPAAPPVVASKNEPPPRPVAPTAPAVKPEAKPVVERLKPFATFKPPPAPLLPLPLPAPKRQSQNPIVMRPLPLNNLELADAEPELNLELVEDRDFHAGDVVALRIRVSRGAGGEADVVANAPVTVKVLGTTFRPLICTAMTDRDGIAVVFTTLPRFKSGRAAILIRVVVGSDDAEMRRIILPS